jgi:hypothetical protein
MIRMKSVEILYVDDNGNEDVKEYNVGDMEEVGDKMRSRWIVEKITGIKTKPDATKEEAIRLLNDILNECTVPISAHGDFILLRSIRDEADGFLNSRGIRNTRRRRRVDNE